jgi:pimeloyl-ACP methyl ester carboxylesterase
VVVEGGLSSAREMGQRLFPLLPVHWVSRARLDNLGAVKEIGAPTLFIHGSEDEIIPISMGRRLHEASPSRLKEFYEVEGARHNTVWALRGAEVASKVRSFVERAESAGASTN